MWDDPGGENDSILKTKGIFIYNNQIFYYDCVNITSYALEKAKSLPIIETLFICIVGR